MPDWDRRRFLRVSGGVAVASVAMGVVGRLPARRPRRAVRRSASSSRPRPRRPRSCPASAQLDVPGITPIVVPNDQFYRIDTALFTPRVDVATWQLTHHGHGRPEVTLTYDDLAAMPLFEQYVTIACVSNEVGGDLVGNALWTGVDLREVLDMAGVQPDATQIVGRSVDGFTVGFPTAWAMDPARRPMIALGMNGAPLPVAHGYPARLIVPGLYGYVQRDEVALGDRADDAGGVRCLLGAAGVGEGSADPDPVTHRRARSGAARPAGARSRSRASRGRPTGASPGSRCRSTTAPGSRPTISEPLSDATWVQWMLLWDAAQGEHRISVRATDGDGVVQTDERTPPAPDGARGHHTITVAVT